jgi:hypothetical protein
MQHIVRRVEMMDLDPTVKTSPSDHPATVVAAGVLAATLAAICHETLGHGLGCIGVGGQITLLTSIWFRCQGATSITDAGGSIASLLAGVASIALLSFKVRNSVAQLVLILFGAFSLFWFAAQLIDHPILNKDDWAFIARRMEWPWIWRPIMVVIGVAAYIATVRIMSAVLRRKCAPGKHAIRLAYASATTSAIVAGLMWRVAPFVSAKEAFLTLGIAPLGLLVASMMASRTMQGNDRDSPDLHSPIPASWALIVGSAVVFAVFSIVQGRGLGQLAQIGLHR